MDSIDATSSMTETFEAQQQFFKHITSLLRRQQRIHQLNAKFNAISKNCFLVGDFIAAGSLCFLLFAITETKDVMLIVQYVLPTMGLILFTLDQCYHGAQLEEASKNLETVVYNHNWYEGSKKYRKLIILSLGYSQQTIKLNAYGMMDVNMVHFTHIMRTAYNLLAFLKSH
ncbi:odorant receptor 88a-like [Scaptodrosophila lebanonensis]|uniref:Odorant receptor 88a-like n=1 Tax=Drosophila lebanonensis TaxID=7225 RepID=A0A6J2TH39_DROLE|nr:odorant receptor 88a-like [Scaptodrosophila lebanonensis]